MRPISASEMRSPPLSASTTGESRRSGVDGAAGTVISARTWRRSLDKRGNPDAAVNSLRAQLSLLLAQRHIGHALDEEVDTALVRHVGDVNAGRGGARIGVVGHHIAAPELNR